MRSFALACISALVALAAARTTPDYSLSPGGNPIYAPGLNEQVPIGEPYTITWDPTTPGTVSLVLLRGPSTNILPLETLVEGIENSGSYVWTPSTDLEIDTTHYGLLLIVDATGEYQYSTQFGISNPDGPVSSSSVGTSTTTTVPYTTSVPTTVVTTTLYNYPSSYAPVPSSSVVVTSKPVIPTPVATGSTTTTSVGHWTGTTSIPTTTSINPSFTGAAAHHKLSYGVVAAGIAAVLAV